MYYVEYVASRRVLVLHVVLLYKVADVEKLVVPIVNYCLLHLVKLQALIKMSKTQPRVPSSSYSSLPFADTKTMMIFPFIP